METVSDTRLDKWLWSVRVFKTRAEATDACRGGLVKINGLAAKPARDVHVGETVVVRIGLVTRTLKVLGLPRSRVGGKLVPEFVRELTPPDEFEKARQARVEHMLARERGRGRPTKKERRSLAALFGLD
jgi:ribosome-associated heat shock protein Hsp15